MHSYILMKAITTPFIPDELQQYWDAEAKVAHAAYALYSVADIAQAMPPLLRPRDQHGAAYAVLPAAHDTQPSHAIVVPLPFASDWGPSAAVRMGLLRALLPNAPQIIVFPNNSVRVPDVYRLDTRARQQVACGDFAPVAAAQLRTLHELGVTTVQYFGYSQGASVSAAALRLLAEPAYAHISVGPSGLFAMPNVVRRATWQVARDFMADIGSLQHTIKASALPALNEIRCLRGSRDAAAWAADFIQSSRNITLPVNSTLRAGFGYPTFWEDFTTALQTHGTVITAGAGSDDRMVPPSAFATLEHLAATHQNLRILRVSGQGHSMADNVVAHALLGKALFGPHS